LTKEGYLTCMLARGPKKYMGMGKIDMSPCHRRIDIMYTKPEEYSFAILYFTGSGDFNVRMRDDALKQGYTMNEYSIKHTDTGLKVEQVFAYEKDIFKFLGYEYLEPEDRI
jgi:DNA polymerase (family X)